MRCLNCDHTIPRHSKFCAYCGVSQRENAAYHYLVLVEEELRLGIDALDNLPVWLPRSRNNLQPALDTIAMVRGELEEAMIKEANGERPPCDLCGGIVIRGRCAISYSVRHQAALRHQTALAGAYPDGMGSEQSE